MTKETLDRCSIFDFDGKPESEQSHLKMIYYSELRNIDSDEKITPSQLLFGGRYKDESDENEAFQWLMNHQSEAILYFDGLDQATLSIDKSSTKKMMPFAKRSISQIMYNLLSRNLLPHVKIVFTSREFKVSELPAEARPDEIVSLVGLTRNDAEKLYVALVGKTGADSWATIKKLSPRLLNLVSVPVFLVLTAAVTARDPKSPPPITITDLYNRILLSLRCVENIQEREQIMKVVRKLKKMAHQGMVEGRVVFRACDLENVGLSIQDARDLILKVPGNKLLSRHLVEGDFLFFFCHQSLQEFLSASFVAEMNVDQFSSFNGEHLHKRRWSVVCTFVSGIIHEDSASELHFVSSQKMKQDVFDRIIRSRITSEKAVELISVIYESNNDDFIQSLPRLPSVRSTRLGPDDAHMFSSIWARRGRTKREKEVT